MNDDRPIGNDAWKEPPVLRWGIDISSTKIEGVIIDEAEPGKALFRLCLPITRFYGYDHIISQVQLLVTELEDISGMSRPRKIGISTPGILQPSTKVLRNPSTCCLNGHTVKNDLSMTLGVEVVLSNDANCFTLSEALFGAAHTYNVVIGLILETGIGAGIVAYQHLLNGLHGISGEWGHSTMHGEEAICHCGKKGCIETVLSESSLEHFYEKITGLDLSFSEIVKRAKLDEAAAVETLERFQDKFAEAIADIINILDPDAIVIGGSIGSIDLLYEESTRAKILPHIYSDVFNTPFLRPILGDSAKAFGAAMLGGLAIKKN